jgi:hypothetical protein
VSLRNRGREDTSGNIGFFLISFLYIDLENYYRINFSLMHDHHFTLEAIDGMMPWEREIYLVLLKEWIKEEKERIEAEKRKHKPPPRRR